MSATVEQGQVEGEESTELKRAIGPKLLLLFIVGDILGTGVYSLTGRVASEVGERPGRRSSSPSPSPW